MNSSTHVPENLPTTEAVEIYTFSHKWMLLDEEKYQVSLSEEAQEELFIYIEELKKTFETYDAVEMVDEEISIDIADQVAEIMKEEGKKEKIIKRFIKRVNKLLRGDVKEKNVEKITRKVERKFKKFHPNQRRKIQIQCKNAHWENINLLPMNIWPETELNKLIGSYNILLSNEKRRIDKENKKNN